MPHKKRKVRKKRGSRTHGFGVIGQHRGGGQRGGRGKAGFHKHKWTYTIKYDPERFGKHGFNPPIREEINAINVGKLEEQIPEFLRNKQAKKTKGSIKINLNRLGYNKLLGKGKVKLPLIIEVAACSRSAAEKIEKVGGKILKAEH